MLNTVKSATVVRGSGPPPSFQVKKPGPKSWQSRLDGAIQVYLGINLSDLDIAMPQKRVRLRRKVDKPEQLELDLFRILEDYGIPRAELDENRELILDKSRPETVDLAIEKLKKYIKFIALKLSIPGVYFDDLVEQGRIGVWNAWDSYDASKGASFFTWTIYRVRWAMLDLMDEEKKKYKDSSIDEEIGEDGVSFHEVIPAPEPRMSVCDSVLLKEIWDHVDRLPERFKKFTYLRFNPDDELTLQEIGDLMGFSRQHAEKMEKKVIALLKSMILDAKAV